MTRQGTVPGADGQVITFYSFKGGTGRSMALANVASLLARSASSERRVLMMDWDFEAPGLHRFFAHRFSQVFPEGNGAVGGLDMAPGLMDFFHMVHGRTKGSDCPGADASEEEADRFVASLDVDSYCLETDIPGLYLAKAGRFDEDYAATVNGFGWSTFHARVPWLFRALAARLSSEFRYVLVDSRTGLTDTSGICTMLLPEKLVVVFTPNRQSLAGLQELIRRALNYRRQSDDLRPLAVYPLASRIDDSERELKEAWRRTLPKTGGVVEIGYQPLFEDILRTCYDLPECNLATYFDEVQIQHYPAFAYGETIAVEVEATGDRLSLTRSYERFADYLINLGNPWENLEVALAGREVERLLDKARRLLGQGEPLAAEAVIREAAERYASLDGLEDPGVFDALQQLAQTFVEARQFEHAAGALQRALAMAEGQLGRDHPRLAAQLERLAACHQESGRNQEALDFATRALGLRKAALGEDSPRLAESYRQVAELYEALGRPKEHKAHLERALALGGDAGDRKVIVTDQGTGADNVIVSGESLWRHPTRRMPSQTLLRATETFLASQVARYQYLDFKGMGIAHKEGLRCP